MRGVSKARVYHVIPLSNFARGYDKYAGAYDKSGIPESRFPDRFFVLDRDELHIGLDKTAGLLGRLGLEGDGPLVLCGEVDPASLHPNLATGLGRYVMGTGLPVDALLAPGSDGALVPISIEEAYAASLRVAHPTLVPYADLRPRTLSILPIARACQASCRFCFSEASASIEQLPHRIPLARVDALARLAREAGASRFVITGGGEPGILPHGQLMDLIRIGSGHLGKTVLITNGFHLARLGSRESGLRMRDYAESGLSVLSLSRHHWDCRSNAEIMGLDTGATEVIGSWREEAHRGAELGLRLICVLQKGGVQDGRGISAYLDWAIGQGVDEVCFKELYVSSMLESAYHDHPENRWARDNQVRLHVLVDFLVANGFEIAERLPWGAPVLVGEWSGRRMRVAAYTEPSLHWERSRGVARSWNIMSDASCLASLEDPTSRVHEQGATP